MSSMNVPSSGPLNNAQRRLWYLYQTAADRHQFNLVGTFDLCGPVDARRLRRAIDALQARHPALHSRIENAGGGRQVVMAPQPVALSEHDLSPLSTSAQNRVVDDYQRQQLCEPFDLTESTAPRWQLFKKAADSYQLALTVHHIVFDGQSSLVVMKELAALYSAAGDIDIAADGKGLIDHARWEQSEEALQSCQTSLSFWQSRLQDFPDHFPLPATHSSEPGTGLFTVNLDAASVTRLRAWARAQRLPLFVVLKAAFDLLLFHHSRQHRFLVGTDIAGRPLPDFANTVGFFINQLPLPCEIDTTQPVSQWLTQSGREVRRALKHKHAPFDRLVASQAKDRIQTNPPLFQVKMNYQQRPVKGLRFGDAVLTGHQVHQHIGPFYLVLDLVHHEDGLSAEFEYQKRFFGDHKIRLMAHQWQRILENFGDLMPVSLADADARLAEWGREALLAQQRSAQQRDAQHRSVPKLKRRRTR